ncbi:MAG: hypothetical protein K0S76_2552 [Herbinix sp.]|jgi:cell division transport system permease protein|nr:hypothetical protein [Herbinix sp.]
MKTFFYNLVYFIREAKNTIRFNLLSNFFSILGTGLILFLLGLVITGGSVGNQFITMLSNEAEISAYFADGTDSDKAELLVTSIGNLEGVQDARLINASEAKEQMKELLGNEAEILELFEENPFEAFIEVRIDLEAMDQVLSEVGNLNGIEYVRDNRAVLEQLQGIIDGLSYLGYLIIAAVGITTLIIISHMIRQGIYNNKDQINTLRLLGAPGAFIGFPFVLVGLLLTLIGGGIAAGLLIPLIGEGSRMVGESLLFLPMPSVEELIQRVVIVIFTVSTILGVAGSLFGLISIKKVDNKG